MRVLVTGAGGFVGKHLVSRLVNKGHQVFAGLRQGEGRFDSPVSTVFLDLVDASKIDKIVEAVKPDGLIHLAAQSMVKIAWQDPANTLLINTVGTINLINSVKLHAPNAKIITVGSSEEYGVTAKKGEPLTEEDACFPQNPYATSKLAMGQVVLQLAKKDQLNIIHVRPFNHFGPGQQEGFVVSDFASQISRIENDLLPPVMKVGDLSAKRDFTDVRDVIEAYVHLLEKPVESGVYNVCSGFPQAISDILNMLLQKANLPIEVQIDSERFRPSEVPVFIGSSDKIRQATGWRPKRNFEESLFETLEWWRKQVKTDG